MNEQTMERAKSTATGFVGRQVDDRRQTIATEIGTHVGSLRTVAENLRGTDGAQPAAQVADRLADYLERAGTYLHERDFDELLVDAERFGRTRPWAVATAALIAGFAVSRFLKTSSVERYRAALSGSGA